MSSNQKSGAKIGCDKQRCLKSSLLPKTEMIYSMTEGSLNYLFICTYGRRSKTLWKMEMKTSIFMHRFYFPHKFRQHQDIPVSDNINQSYDPGRIRRLGNLTISKQIFYINNCLKMGKLGNQKKKKWKALMASNRTFRNVLLAW